MKKSDVANLIMQGFNACHRGGLSHEEVADLLEIRSINGQSKRMYEQYNSSGGRWPENYEQKDERLDKKAKAIAAKHGWTIQAPGLWWRVLDSQGNDITLQV